MSKGLYATVDQINSDAIIPNFNKNMGVTSNVASGEVTYTATSQSNGQVKIVTAIRVPAGTKTCNRLSLYDGNSSIPIQDGNVLLSTNVPQTGARKTTYGLEFLDDHNQVISSGVVFVQIETAELEPWAAYIQRWKPVPAENLLLSFGGASGIRMPYQSGVLSYDFSQIVSNMEILTNDSVSISVVPPSGAQYVKQNCMGGGEGLLGNHPRSEAEAIDMMQFNQAESAAPTISVGEWPVLNRLDMFDNVTLFVPTVPVNLDAGLVYLFFWYNSEEELNQNTPSEVWWFAERAAPFVKVTKNVAVSSEEQVPAWYEGAIVIGKVGWTLITEDYLQKGDNAQFYEIHLADNDGNIINPQENVVVYLPYPQGHSYDDGHTYTLKHYTADGEEMVSRLLPMENGLRFMVNSFSPFVLGWTKPSEPTPTASPTPSVSPVPSATPVKPPKTGDASEPFLWSVALMLALLGVGVLALHRHPKRKA
ncbi:MAG: hypothetical protein PHI98_17160 [Eubacteriales bacterium]|nr:hypothetical protein [Eubacteriales bacterium]